MGMHSMDFLTIRSRASDLAYPSDKVIGLVRIALEIGLPSFPPLSIHLLISPSVTAPSRVLSESTTKSIFSPAESICLSACLIDCLGEISILLSLSIGTASLCWADYGRYLT